MPTGGLRPPPVPSGPQCHQERTTPLERSGRLYRTLLLVAAAALILLAFRQAGAPRLRDFVINLEHQQVRQVEQAGAVTGRVFRRSGTTAMAASSQTPPRASGTSARVVDDATAMVVNVHGVAGDSIGAKPAVEYATGFWVGPDTLVTAQHATQVIGTGSVLTARTMDLRFTAQDPQIDAAAYGIDRDGASSPRMEHTGATPPVRYLWALASVAARAGEVVTALCTYPEHPSPIATRLKVTDPGPSTLGELTPYGTRSITGMQLVALDNNAPHDGCSGAPLVNAQHQVVGVVETSSGSKVGSLIGAARGVDVRAWLERLGAPLAKRSGPVGGK